MVFSGILNKKEGSVIELIVLRNASYPVGG